MLSRHTFEQLVHHASLAPSGHNTQPWQFQQQHDSIIITPDYRRALPVVDPDNRELFISLGCAAENLRIAALDAGYQADLTIDDAHNTLHIHLTERPPEPQPLLAYLAKRQTNRAPYQSQALTPEHLAALQNIPLPDGIHQHFYENGSAPFQHLSEYICAGNTRQMQNPAFKAELKHWLRYNKKHQDRTRDGISYAVFGAPNVPRLIAKAIMSLMMNANTQNRADRRKIATSAGLMLITVAHNTVPQWICAGQTLQRLLLTATAHDIAHAYLNQPCEERDLAAQMAEQLGLRAEIPVLLLRLGYGTAQAYSLRCSLQDIIL